MGWLNPPKVSDYVDVVGSGAPDPARTPIEGAAAVSEDVAVLAAERAGRAWGNTYWGGHLVELPDPHPVRPVVVPDGVEVERPAAVPHPPDAAHVTEVELNPVECPRDPVPAAPAPAAYKVALVGAEQGEV